MELRMGDKFQNDLDGYVYEIVEIYKQRNNLFLKEPLYLLSVFPEIDVVVVGNKAIQVKRNPFEVPKSYIEKMVYSDRWRSLRD